MCTEVEAVAGVAPTERSAVSAHLPRAVLVADMAGQGHGDLAAKPALDPRHVYSVAYYMHRLRDVGYGWDHAE